MVKKKQKLNEVLIFKESNFIKKHLKSIFLIIKRLNILKRYFTEIKKKFLKKNHTHLINLNYDLIKLCLQLFKYKKKIYQKFIFRNFKEKR